MTSNEIRSTAMTFGRTCASQRNSPELNFHVEESKVAALWEIAAQLAESNEHNNVQLTQTGATFET